MCPNGSVGIRMGWFTRIPEYKIDRMEVIVRIGWPNRMEFIARIGWPRRRKCTRVLVCLRDNRWSMVLVRVGHLLIDFRCSPECPCLPEYSTATRIPSIPRIPEWTNNYCRANKNKYPNTRIHLPEYLPD